MNSIMLEMLGRQRQEEMMRAAEEARRVPAGPVLEPVGGLLIRIGRGLERAGERLAGTPAREHALGASR